MSRSAVTTLLWIAFAVFAVLGGVLDIGSVFSIACWSLALIVALVLVARMPRDERSADDRA